MGITLLGVLFVVALFAVIAVAAHFTRTRVIEPPLEAGRARGSAVTEFVDDLQRYRWAVIITLAVLVALDQSYDFSKGLLQSKLVLAIVITAIFVVRLLLRRNRRTHF